MVPAAGLEPARPQSQRILSPSCLPVPPSGHEIISPFRTEKICDNLTNLADSFKLFLKEAQKERAL